MRFNRLLRCVGLAVPMLGVCLSPLAMPATGRAESKAIPEVSQDSPAFALQGEYIAQVVTTAEEGKKLHAAPVYAAQVIAKKDNAFTLVLLAGGLPGDGWDGKGRWEAAGQLVEGKVHFAQDDSKVTADLADGTLTGTLGDQSFSLKKTLRISPTMGLKPPTDAVVLFDGEEASLKNWVKVEYDKENHLLGVVKSRAITKASFGDMTLHLEFRTPFMPAGTGQARGNSGVYLQQRYEVQVLDSFGLVNLDNDCGGIYKVAPAKVNMCFPPRSWQTYDIDFTAARYDDTGKKIANARVTVKLNGQVIHDNQELPKQTGGGQNEAAPDKGTLATGPLFLQDHGNPVYYRNIWVVQK